METGDRQWVILWYTITTKKGPVYKPQYVVTELQCMQQYTSSYLFFYEHQHITMPLSDVVYSHPACYIAYSLNSKLLMCSEVLSTCDISCVVSCNRVSPLLCIHSVLLMPDQHAVVQLGNGLYRSPSHATLNNSSTYILLCISFT